MIYGLSTIVETGNHIIKNTLYYTNELIESKINLKMNYYE